MKKYIAVIAACAVIGTAGVAVVKNKMPSEDDKPTTSTYENAVNSQKTGDKTTTSAKSTSAKSDENNQSKSNNTSQSFSGVIESVNGFEVSVAPDKGESIRSTASVVRFDAKSAQLVDESGVAVRADDVKNFARVKVFYDGAVMETYPAQVNAKKAVLADREYCNVYFYSDKNELINTLRIKVGDSLESADMPNGGAYCPDGYHFVGWEYDSQIVDGINKLTSSATLKAVISQD